MEPKPISGFIKIIRLYANPQELKKYDESPESNDNIRKLLKKIIGELEI